jgi:hypothetical protein
MVLYQNANRAQTKTSWCNPTFLMLPPHIAEHSPHDLEWGCVDSVLALARGMFGIRAECERRYV